MEPTTTSSSVQSPGGATLQGASSEQRAKNEGGSASGDKQTNNEQQQSSSSSQGTTPSSSSSSSILPSNTATTTTTSMCLAGLGTYVERLCGLCEAGSGMGALWTQCLESGGSDGGMLQRLNAVLADLNSLALLEATQLNMSVERAQKHGDKTKVRKKNKGDSCRGIT